MRGLEHHADQNQLMPSPHDFLGSFGIFEGDTTFYLGGSIALTFEDGTQLEPEPWLAYYHSQDRLRLVEAFTVSSFQSSIMTCKIPERASSLMPTHPAIPPKLARLPTLSTS